MKEIYTLFILLLLNFVAQSQDTLWWHAAKKLEWKDFQHKPKGSDHGASSFVGIQYKLSFRKDSIISNVSCYFIRNKSWIRQGNNDSLLAHEQGHFDIGELFARKLKIAFAAQRLNISSSDRDFKSIFNRIKKEKEDMNKMYDKDTEFSKNISQQKTWIIKIRRELGGLQHYANR